MLDFIKKFFKTIFATPKTVVGNFKYANTVEKKEITIKVFNGEVICDHCMDCIVERINQSFGNYKENNIDWSIDFNINGKRWVINTDHNAYDGYILQSVNDSASESYSLHPQY